MSQSIRVLIVDDSAFMRNVIRRLLSAEPDCDVVGTASNGVFAVREAERLKPDVVTLDIEMPEMDGLTALPQIKRVCGARVLMVSSLTGKGSRATLQALRLGAEDFITKEQSQVTLQLGSIESQLVTKVRQLGRAASAAAPSAPPAPCDDSGLSDLYARPLQVVAIASSTGGPPVLEQLVAGLPADFPAPVVIAQHMPALFTEAMAERFNQIGPLHVEHGRHGMRIAAGTIYIAPGGLHTRIRQGIGRAMWLDISDKPTHLLYKPSADELLRSAGEVAEARALGIVLTGMGDDGKIGARTLHERGGHLIAQDHETCVVYGMPKAVAEAGLAHASLPPQHIVRVLQRASRSQIAAPPVANAGK